MDAMQLACLRLLAEEEGLTALDVLRLLYDGAPIEGVIVWTASVDAALEELTARHLIAKRIVGKATYAITTLGKEALG